MGGGTLPKPQDSLNDNVVSVICDEINLLVNPFDDDTEFNNEMEGKWSRSLCLYSGGNK